MSHSCNLTPCNFLYEKKVPVMMQPLRYLLITSYVERQLFENLSIIKSKQKTFKLSVNLFYDKYV